ncbi:DUF4227 family protein [Paenibacillus cisolokensis]|jgi:hypothetical protein|uniref:DUF4227 domain-containing protein n=1 Tax=Paenibacillus cisolokensis TaxID=1658519 RepID=A0ABQ4NER5_9BACL|nr:MULTISPECIES: DUF4227 family protein [Paenibacillus]ALS28374.1 hypothetical protein IJ21_29780 [Paenibacillus sp. 32O-W]GIQ66725.1 hypothetical protein PACILC2_52930 [Paenibacillus cisolokensis]
MVVSVRKWVGNLLFMTVFLALFLVVSGGYRWLLDFISPVDPYREPQGEAVKAFRQLETYPEGGSVVDTLRWFYWYGQ